MIMAYADGENRDSDKNFLPGLGQRITWPDLRTSEKAGQLPEQKNLPLS
jgi:hypothetical protein